MLSDTLGDAEENISSYREEYYEDWFEQIDQILCKIIVLRIELNELDDDKLPENAFHKAALAGDYEAYKKLIDERDIAFNAEDVGLRETGWMQRIKFFVKLK